MYVFKKHITYSSNKGHQKFRSKQMKSEIQSFSFVGCIIRFSFMLFFIIIIVPFFTHIREYFSLTNKFIVLLQLLWLARKNYIYIQSAFPTLTVGCRFSFGIYTEFFSLHIDIFMSYFPNSAAKHKNKVWWIYNKVSREKHIPKDTFQYMI